MKFRLLSACALAGAIALGASGCSLLAPVATLDQYHPSDGVNLKVGTVNIRNMMLIKGAENTYNLVFTSVNSGADEQELNFSISGVTPASVDLRVPAGTTAFGLPTAEVKPVLVNLGDLTVGSTVQVYVSSSASASTKIEVPVLDGTLKEYREYVLDAAGNTVATTSTEEHSHSHESDEHSHSHSDESGEHTHSHSDESGEHTHSH